MGRIPSSLPEVSQILFRIGRPEIEPLADEIRALNADPDLIRSAKGGVSFAGGLELGMAVCLHSRFATRVLLRVAFDEYWDSRDVYALAKKRFVGRKLLFTLIVCAMALPKQVILIPLLREMSALNLYNTIWAVIFPIVGWPFGVFLMKQFSEGIPTEMLEAARIDGASEARTFISVVLPMVKPGIGALAIFTFINSWNDYFMQLIMLSSTSNLTISLGIAKLQAENSTDFGLIMAGAALAAVPIIIIFLIFQKYFTKGIAMGAVKG